MTAAENDADTLPVTSDQEGFPRDHTWLLGQRWDKLSSCIQSDLNGYIAVDDIIGRDSCESYGSWPPPRCRIRRGTGAQVMASLRNLARLSEPAVTGLSRGDVSDSLTRARDEFVCFDKNACFGLNSLVFQN